MNPYRIADDALLYGAEKLLQGWNWTTGRSKESLLNTIYPIGLWLVIQNEPKWRVTGIPIGMALNSMLCKAEKNIEGTDTKDPLVEGLHYFSKPLGLFFLSNFVMQNSPPNPDRAYYFEETIGSGLLLAYYYLIRTENIPPRKNVLARAKDKISELSRVRTPALTPNTISPQIPLEEKLL
jgi:hypothetical protein